MVSQLYCCQHLCVQLEVSGWEMDQNPPPVRDTKEKLLALADDMAVDGDIDRSYYDRLRELARVL